MTHAHTPADDLVYDLVSIQYHALKGAQLYEQFKDDAHGHDDVISFLDRVIAEDVRRAEECHALLRTLTAEHGIAGTGEPPMGQGSFPMGSADEGLGAGSTSAQAQAGDVTGGGTTTGISSAADADGADCAAANASTGAATT